MLYEGFEIDCIHRCISQTSCCWLRRLSLCAVSYFLTLQPIQVIENQRFKFELSRCVLSSLC